MSALLRQRWLTPMVLAVAMTSGAPAETPREAVLAERVVAGGPDDFMEVRHVTIHGSNVEIGRALAGLAQEHFGVTAKTSIPPQRTQEQREWFARHFPQFVERTRGVAESFNGDFNDNATNYASLSFGFSAPGCSVVYYPPALTVDADGALSRNFDFTTGTFDGRTPGRTLWHALYRPEQRRLEVDFYLGEAVDSTSGTVRIRRSGYVRLGLDPDR